MTLAVLDPWIALAKEWQPLLAGLLAVLAAIIIAAGMIISARIRAARSGANRNGPDTRDLRVPASLASLDNDSFDSINANLEKLRSLLRSALSALSTTGTDDEAARSLCARIGAFQWKQFPLPADADTRLREVYATFLNQFDLLEVVLAKDWSPSEASAILIQLNANARALCAILSQQKFDTTKVLGHQNKN